jgi:hypothetical protein
MVSLEVPNTLVYESRFTYVGAESSGYYRWTMSIAPEDTGARVIRRMERRGVPWWFMVLQRIVSWPLFEASGVVKELRRLKERLEPPPASFP